jgi:hypothetical protein
VIEITEHDYGWGAEDDKGRYLNVSVVSGDREGFGDPKLDGLLTVTIIFATTVRFLNFM